MTVEGVSRWLEGLISYQRRTTKFLGSRLHAHNHSSKI